MRKQWAAMALALALTLWTPLALAEAEDTENAGVDPLTGTAVLVGAGAYTMLRGKWQEKKRETKDTAYIPFENHTKNGTLTEEEKARDL